MVGLRGVALLSIVLVQYGSDRLSTRSDADQPGICRIITIHDKPVTTYVLGSGDSLVIGWLNQHSKPHKSFKSFMGDDRAQWRLVTNAGMFHSNHHPVGLYIQDDSTYVRLDTNSGKGNFYMKPNGVFGVGADGPWIGTSETYLAQSPQLHLATQSGPMLVINDSIHPRFNPQSPNKNTRSGVGVDDQNRVVFAIAYKDITFYELATVFRDSLNCSNALYLDGAISKMYLHTSTCTDSFTGGNFGPMLGVMTK